MALDMSLPRAGLPSQRRDFAHYPWHVALLVAGIAAIGVWNLASAARSAHTPVWISQLSWMGVGAGVALAVGLVDYRRFMRGAYVFYALVLVLLIATALKGRVVMGARRWLTIGPVNLQPSELAKIAVALALARWFHMDAGKRKDGYGLFGLIVPALITFVPAVLILKQPDLGTALIVVSVGATMILFAKVRWKTLLAVVVVVSVGAVFAYPHLKPYQKKRVETFLDPEGDVLGAGYHASQSMIAVGHGGVGGTGYAGATQTRLNYLPEHATDRLNIALGDSERIANGPNGRPPRHTASLAHGRDRRCLDRRLWSSYERVRGGHAGRAGSPRRRRSLRRRAGDAPTSRNDVGAQR